MTHATADFIDWAAQLDARGLKWYCGHVFPVDSKAGGFSGDDIANFPRCDRWHDTREERENCDHGGARDEEPATTPTPPAEAPVRTNRADGRCYWCGGTVLAGQGRLEDLNGMLVPVHLNGGC